VRCIKRGISLGLLYGTSIAVGCAPKTPPLVAGDLSAPKPAAVTFLRAAVAGDLETAKNASVGSDADKRWIGAMALLVNGLKSYDRAIVAHFGTEATADDAQIKRALLELVDDSIAHVKEGLVKEDSDVAEVDPAWNGLRLSARPPIFLRKERGLWKVDLPTTAKFDPRFSPETVERYTAYGRALSNAARDINAGRYKTLAQAERESDTRVP
jgi:hypothetical protein